MKIQPEHNLLLKWLILTGLIGFSAIVAWNEGVISSLYSVDKSHISMAITLIYLLVTLHCAQRIYTILRRSYYVGYFFLRFFVL